MFKKLVITYSVIFVMVFNLAAISVFAEEEYSAVAVNKILTSTNISQLQAKGAILMDSASGNIIMEQNSNQKLPIASVTKVMTMLLIMEAIDSGKINYNDPVPVSEHAMSMGGSQLYLDTKESNKYTVSQILKGVAVHSSNDATVAMAELVAGSEGTFVELMNQKAEALGLSNTHFIDCTGLTDDGHYSTAYDIAVMSRELIMKHPKILEYSVIKRDKFGEGVRAPKNVMDLDNTNKLLGRYDGMLGLKTGFTNKAGHNLAAVAKRNGMQLISVVLGESDSNTRFAESMKLLDYGFANYETVLVNKKGEVAGEVDVLKGLTTKVKAVYSEDINLLLKKGEKNKFVRDIKWETDITAPIKEGQKLGTVTYKIDDRELGSANITAQNSVEKASFIRLFFRMMLSWFGLGRS